MAAAILPYADSVVGLVGALAFYPAGVFMPIELWIRVHKPRRRTIVALETLSAFCLLVSAAAFISSIKVICSQVAAGSASMQG